MDEGFARRPLVGAGIFPEARQGLVQACASRRSVVRRLPDHFLHGAAQVDAGLGVEVREQVGGDRRGPFGQREGRFGLQAFGLSCEGAGVKFGKNVGVDTHEY